ncbi:hypothetical protein AVEN_77140-1, partial [Araneus ventricosus]
PYINAGIKESDGLGHSYTDASPDLQKCYAISNRLDFCRKEMLLDISRRRDVLSDLLFGRQRDSHSQYTRDLEAHQESVHEFARERINLVSDRMKTRYDSRSKI